MNKLQDAKISVIEFTHANADHSGCSVKAVINSLTVKANSVPSYHPC